MTVMDADRDCVVVRFANDNFAQDDRVEIDMFRGLNFDLPPAQSAKRRLFWRISGYRRQISSVSEVLLQFTGGQITGFSQDLLVLLFQLFPKELHFPGTCCVNGNSSPFAACRMLNS
jgi:hypothetical protein